MNIEQARDNMVEQQVRTWDVLDQRVLDAMRQIPRERFVPERFGDLAFSDTAIPLDFGEAMMAPKVEGRMLQALALRSTDRVLEVGTGTGYTAALAARLAGSVHSIDIHERFSTEALERLSMLGIPDVTTETADAIRDFRPAEQFDAIALTGAVATLPGWCFEALAPGGRLFAIVGSGPILSATLTMAGPSGAPVTERLFETVVPYLRGAEPKTPFEF